ncbi:MAG: class I SAM-dependent methyltransferase, partial [Actinomycetota bacterium]
FEATRQELLRNLVQHGIDDRVMLIERDYRVAFGESLPPVAVYLFDGPHNYMDQYSALELVEPHLVDGALVIVDDTSWRHVARANADFVRSHPRFSLLCDLPSKQLQDHRWWNGVQVFEYARSASAGARDLRHVAHRIAFALIQPMRLYEVFYPARGRVLEWWDRRRTTD